ncbi:MAG TPA: hypothetical protein VGF86_09655 [Candidatus Tumulicola sp.]|jgi:hypothetical protein
MIDFTAAEMALCQAHGRTIARMATIEERDASNDVPKQKLVLQFSDGSELELWSEDFRPQFHETSRSLPSVIGDTCESLQEHRRRHPGSEERSQ